MLTPISGLPPGADSFALILAEIADGVSVQDAAGRLVYVNDAAAQVIGYPTAAALLAAVGSDLTDRFEMIDEAGHPLPSSALPGRQVLAGQPAAGAVIGYKLRATGTTRWSMVRARPLRIGGDANPYVVNIFHDITERKQATDTARVAQAHFQFLAEASELLAASLDYQTTLKQVAQLAVPHIADWCSMDLLDAEGTLQQVIAVHVDPAKVAYAHELQRRYPPNRAAPSGPYQVIRTQQTEFYPDIPDHLLVAGARDPEHLAIIRALGLTAIITVPLVARQQALGVLTLVSAESGRRYTTDDVALAEDLARRAAVAIDNARLYQAAESIRQELAVTLASIGDAVIATDAAGRVRFLNAVAEKLTGWPLAAAVGQPVQQVFHIIHEETRQPVESPVPRVLREGAIVGLANHTALVARDGSTRSIDDSGAPIRDAAGHIQGAVLVFRDVTTRRHAEEALRVLAAVGARLNASLDHTATLQSLADLLVPRFADWCAIDLLDAAGHLQETVTHHLDPQRVAWLRRMREQYPPDRHAAGGLMRALQTGQGQALFTVTEAMLVAEAQDAAELAFLHDYGTRSIIWVPLHARGRSLGVLTLAHTASGRTYTVADLTVAEEIARQAGQALDNAALYQDAQAAIRTRDQFLLLASHELKTPLTTLLAGMQLIARRQERAGLLTAADRRTWTLVQGQVTRLNRLILALLDLSRIQTGQLQLEQAPLDLTVLTQRLVEEAQPGLEQHTMHYSGPPAAVMLLGDELRLEQAVQNLLTNAVKYSPAGGDITVQITVTAEQACLTVQDSGIGIPSTALPDLFTRFYRAANASDAQIAGLGIGLYVVKEIVTLHGGTVAVTSTEGQGSRFTLCFPLPNNKQ
ncbi:MAG: ATP-binding protein [Chloroflexota bacterium]|nr:ATP-binding protein [Chloroflexota bacterium]